MGSIRFVFFIFRVSGSLPETTLFSLSFPINLN